MRPIDADELKKEVLKWLPSDPCGIEEKEFPFETDIVVSLMMEIEEAPTIEQPAWIPCSERLPEEHEWIGTKTFGTTISDEVYVTFESPKGERFTKHLSFQNGKVPSFKQKEIDVFYKGSVPIAWMPLPKPWEGATDGNK